MLEHKGMKICCPVDGKDVERWVEVSEGVAEVGSGGLLMSSAAERKKLFL